MPDPQHPAARDGSWLDAEVARRLLARRQLLLHGPLDTERATRLAAELMTLEADGPDPITLSINSTGGDLPALFALTDTLQALHPRVDTRCLGQAHGSAVVLVAAATGRRRAGPHAHFVLRLPETDVEGTALDIEQAARAHTAQAEQLFDLIAHVTKRPRSHVVRAWQHGQVLSPRQALAHGLIDDIEG